MSLIARLSQLMDLRRGPLADCKLGRGETSAQLAGHALLPATLDCHMPEDDPSWRLLSHTASRRCLRCRTVDTHCLPYDTADMACFVSRQTSSAVRRGRLFPDGFCCVTQPTMSGVSHLRTNLPCGARHGLLRGTADVALLCHAHTHTQTLSVACCMAQQTTIAARLPLRTADFSAV